MRDVREARRGKSRPFALLGTALAAVLGSALLLALLEGGLRLAGIGDVPAGQASRLTYQWVFSPILEPIERPDGTPALQTVDRRIPRQNILREKTPQGLRIFVVGGSATAGLGYSLNASFPRRLERMLQAALPDRLVEVVNLGVVALASREVAVMVEELAEHYEADLILVHSGNNEFLEHHAERFAGRDQSALARVVDGLGRTNALRALRGLRGGAPPRTMTVAEMSVAGERLSEAELIAEVSLTPEEVEAQVDAYEANLDAMVQACQRAGTPVVLMSVASNWKWRGKQDLPPGWAAELLADAGRAIPEDEEAVWRAASELLSERLAADQGPPYDLHFRRAELAERLGDLEPARAGYRASLNTDPHLRRCTHAQNERVRRVAERHDVPHFDTVAFLAGAGENGLIGFDLFFDYVHFTPEGALRVAAELLRELIALELVPASQALDLDAFLAAELAALETLASDPLEVTRWLGLGAGTARLRDRDLWKHQRACEELDALLEADPRDVHALIWRGNASFFLPGGMEAAERDYRAALEIDPQNGAARENLARLLSSARP